ncbi:MAG: hypothetical protein M3495_04925 [Pseudomonadota bacterium]|nr:hypothetical protein [Chthoniobacterales bacterium]MDQ3580986.1 hypothetical protein [Pseudomonadota bacterium]
MVAVIGQRAVFVVVVLTGNGKNRDADFPELFGGGTEGVVVGIARWMLDDTLEIGRRRW